MREESGGSIDGVREGVRTPFLSSPFPWKAESAFATNQFRREGVPSRFCKLGRSGARREEDSRSSILDGVLDAPCTGEPAREGSAPLFSLLLFSLFLFFLRGGDDGILSP